MAEAVTFFFPASISAISRIWNTNRPFWNYILDAQISLVLILHILLILW